MERNERLRADALDSYWDAIQLDAAPDESSVDSLTKALIAAFHPFTAHQQQEAQQRIRQNLTIVAKSIDAPMSSVTTTPPVEIIPMLSPPDDRVGWAPPMTWKAWATAIAALLIAITAGYLLLAEHDEGAPKTVPAVLAPAGSPVPEITATTLLSYTIPDELLPPGPTAGSGFGRMSIPPNSSSTWQPYCCPGPLVHFVVSGSYTITSESPARVVHLDGSVEDVPVGTEVTLLPGEFLLARNEDKITASNRESSSATILNWVLIDDPDGEFSGHILPGWSKIEANVKGPAIYPGSARVRFQVVTFPIGASLVPAPGVTYFTLVSPYNTQGTPQPGVGFTSNNLGVLENIGKHEIQVYVLTLEQTIPADWTPEAATPDT